jgi:hypothetical protein
MMLFFYFITFIGDIVRSQRKRRRPFLHVFLERDGLSVMATHHGLEN